MPDPARSQRGRKAERRGRRAEIFCAWILRCKGYRILAQRHRTPVGELDVIAQRGRTLVFVEIKARASLTAAAEALRPKQQARLMRAAECFLSRQPDLASRPADAAIRFDAMLIGRRPWPHHVKDAWRKDF